MNKAFSTFILILFLANSLSAQTLETSASETALAPTQTPWGFKIEFNFMSFNGSYGFGVTYDLMEKLSSEVSYTHTNFYGEDYVAGNRSFSTTANAYGLRLNYFPFSSVKSGGFYASTTVSAINLNTDISVKPFLSGTTTKRDLEGQHIGRQVIMGYQFEPKGKKDEIKRTSRIGLGYGNGNSYGIREGWKEYEIADSVFADIALILLY